VSRRVKKGHCRVFEVQKGVVTVLNNPELCRGEEDNLQVLPGAFYYLGLEGPLQAGHGARAGRGKGRQPMVPHSISE
jgi:hypothetical protein